MNPSPSVKRIWKYIGAAASFLLLDVVIFTAVIRPDMQRTARDQQRKQHYLETLGNHLKLGESRPEADAALGKLGKFDSITGQTGPLSVPIIAILTDTDADHRTAKITIRCDFDRSDKLTSFQAAARENRH